MADMIQIPSMEAATLTDVVCRVLGVDSAEVVDWEIRPLTGGFGSTGVYRVSGHARMATGVLPWQVVLKTLRRDPVHDHAGDWNYWQREALLYASGILDSLPPGLRAPRCFWVEERSSEVVWLWLEMLTCPSAVREARLWYLKMAGKLGMFNGANLQVQELPSQPWLQGAWLRSFADWSTPAFGAVPLHLHHPLVQRLWTPSLVTPLLQLWARREILLNAVERLPQTFCHRDVHSGNLFLQPDPFGAEQAVAIDWAFAGRGAVGEDAAALLLSGISLFDLTPQEIVALDNDLFAAYIDSLRVSGWAGDDRLVRLGYVASFALRSSDKLIANSVPMLLNSDEETLDARCREVNGASLAEVLDHAAEVAAFTLVLGEEAHRLTQVIFGAPQRGPGVAGVPRGL